MDMKTRYVVKGIGKEQIISSVVNIYIDEASGKISKVEDKWNGSLPESSIANVSVSQIVSPVWWINYWIAWAFWGWSFVWYTRGWRVRDASLSLLPLPCSCVPSYNRVLLVGNDADIHLRRLSVTSTPPPCPR